MEYYVCGVCSNWDNMVETYYAFSKNEAIKYTNSPLNESQMLQAYGKDFHKSKELNYLLNPRHS